MNVFARLFHARERKVSHRCRNLARNRAELVLEGLESRIVPSAFENVFVVPVSQPTDGIHVHTLEAALQRIDIGSTVTIEPGASPDFGGVTANVTGVTIQGDPNVPASILPGESIMLIGSNNTLTNLNLSSLLLGAHFGDTSTAHNQVSRCLIGYLVESGVSSMFTQNLVSGSAAFEGGTTTGVIGNLFSGNVVANNVFSGSLTIGKFDGIQVVGNTFYSNGTVITLQEAGSTFGLHAYFTPKSVESLIVAGRLVETGRDWCSKGSNLA